jgi:hypothetical protein
MLEAPFRPLCRFARALAGADLVLSLAGQHLSVQATRGSTHHTATLAWSAPRSKPGGADLVFAAGP